MTRALSAFQRLVREEDGQDILEYALLTGLVVLAAVAAIGLTGNAINITLWGYVVANVAAAL